VQKQDVLTDVWREHTESCKDHHHNCLGKDHYHNWLEVKMESKGKPKPEMMASQDTKDAVATKKMEEKLFGLLRRWRRFWLAMQL
jgi:hypothetical protein